MANTRRSTRGMSMGMRGSMSGRRRGGQISGRMHTPAQQAARRRNIRKAQQARRGFF